MMKHPLLSLLQQQTLKLNTRAFVNYKALLYRLCQYHETFEYTKEIRMLLNTNQIDNLLDLADSLSSQKYGDATHHFVANQFAALIRKYPFPSELHTQSPEVKARQKFDVSEHKCHRINQRFISRRKRKGLHPYESYLWKMRSFIAYVIGHQPNLPMIYDNCNFGPGASIGVHGNATNLFRKLSAEKWSVTPSAIHYAYSALRRNQHFVGVMNPEGEGFDCGSELLNARAFMSKVQLVKHNKISYVPKTTKTHRSIAVEPLLNSYVQKGIDVSMRLFLKRIGIDLSDQTPNSTFAREGSRAGAVDPFSTIDLSSASDSIATEVVRELLPPDWFDLLNSIRSKYYMDLGLITKFEKFCSMGNGFCFPLETLIFAAACHAVGAGKPGKDFLVYGDDIVVRQSKFEDLVNLLGYLGFTTNIEKTFYDGPFRESCGSDWFDGKDVRPYILDYALDSVENVYKFINLTRGNDLWSFFFGFSFEIFLNEISPRLHLWRPYQGNPDTGLDSHVDEFLRCPTCSYDRKTRSWRWLEVEATPVRDSVYHRESSSKSAQMALMYAALLGVSSSEPFTVRRKTRTRMRMVSHPGATSQWLPPF